MELSVDVVAASSASAFDRKLAETWVTIFSTSPILTVPLKTELVEDNCSALLTFD